MKYRKLYKRLFLPVLAVCLVLSSNTFHSVCAQSQAPSYHWYVKRNNEHRQPEADGAQALFEKYDAYYVDKTHADNEEDKVLYLTFDAGYENGNVAKILSVLREKKAPAAFFVLKHLLLKEPSLIDRMLQDGHLVCNHTMSHKDTSAMTDEQFAAELDGLATIYKEQTGKEMPRYYRPPEGKYSESNLRCAQKMGYKTIFWSFAYADWDNDKQPDLEAAKKKILENTHNGAVILLHPTSATNAAILADLIDTWRAEGYRFGSLDELTGA